MQSANQALKMIGNHDEAQQAMKLKLLQRKARICIQMNKLEEAKEALNKVISTDSTNKQARALWAALERIPSQSQVDMKLAMQRLIALPRYRPPPREQLE